MATLTSTAIVAAILGLMAPSASAIDVVQCNSNDYLRVTEHTTGMQAGNECFANGGGGGDNNLNEWVTEIWTGNNNVQYLSDGRWQPDQPIPKWTLYTWPNHPGGVSYEGIRIV